MSLDTSSFWKWLAIALAGLLLTMIGAAINERHLDSDVQELREEVIKLKTSLNAQLDQIRHDLAGDNGVGARLADHENRVRALDRDMGELRERIAALKNKGGGGG